jgi:hypothetical protein
LKPQPFGVLPGSLVSKVSVSSGAPGLSGPTLLTPVVMAWPPFAQARLWSMTFHFGDGVADVAVLDAGLCR